LWNAVSAYEWRILYLEIYKQPQEKAMSVAGSIGNITQVRESRQLDPAFSALIVIYCIWSAVWNHSQLNLLARPQTSTDGGSSILTASGSWDAGLPQLLEQLRMVVFDWAEALLPQMVIVFERTLLNLHLSFEQVQLFAGKEGEDEARRAYPLLRQWAATADARKAVWHAGQVLKAASQCPAAHLRDFQAVSLYHAGMAFWTYAVVSSPAGNGQKVQSLGQSSRSLPSGAESDLVWLDGDDCPGVQRFIALNRGTPVVRDQVLDGRTGVLNPILLSRPSAIMNIFINLLKQDAPIEGEGTALPLVENLSQLMHDLGSAADELLRSRQSHERNHV
jgi:hypothetical protein